MCNPILDAKFTVGEVQIGIRHLKHGKSAGDDQILGELISYGEQQFKYVIVDIFNELYEMGIFQINGQLELLCQFIRTVINQILEITEE